MSSISNSDSSHKIFIDAVVVPEDKRNHKKIREGINIVVIDVLRVCTTIVNALANGAERIYPALTVKEAFEKKKSLISQGTAPEDIILGGERKGIKIKGFDLGNSPREYKKEQVKGKTLILSSTNGTKAMKRSAPADRILIGSIRNAAAVAGFLIKDNKDTLFYLSGRQGDFSFEDAAGAGIIIELFSKRTPVELSDASSMCLALYDKHRANLLRMFRQTVHGRFLESIGFMEDLIFSAKASCSNILPHMCKDGFICTAEDYDHCFC